MVMLDLFSYLFGVASILLLESVALIFATDWLRKKVDDDKKAS